MTSRADAPPITEDIVRDLSAKLEEPEWLLERRLDAFRAYAAMSMPDPLEEEWRRTDISGLDLEAALRLPNSATSHWQAGGFNPAVYAKGTLPHEFYFGDLDGARYYHEAEIRERLHTLVKPTEWKLGALQAALQQKGTLVYVPRNVTVEVPLEHILEGVGGPVASHVLIIAEANSSVTFVRNSISGDGGAQSLALDAVEIFAAPDARVSFVDVQRWGDSVYSFSTIRAHLDRGASLSAALVGLGGRLAKTKLEVSLAGEGASAELLGVTFGDGKRHFDYVTLQDHIAPHTSSDLMFKAALDGSSSEVWNGTVRIQKGASQSEANQTSRNLLLSDKAKAAPIPVLEIEAYDVLRCSHGATAGPLDEEQRFYLESRGIPPAEAERLLVEAFYREVIDRIGNESVREKIDALLIEKLERSR